MIMYLHATSLAGNRVHHQPIQCVLGCDKLVLTRVEPVPFVFCFFGGEFYFFFVYAVSLFGERGWDVSLCVSVSK